MWAATSASSSPRSAFTRAAAALIRPSQWITAPGIGSPLTGKFSTALRVSAPHSSRCSVLATKPSLLRPCGAGGARAGTLFRGTSVGRVLRLDLLAADLGDRIV